MLYGLLIPHFKSPIKILMRLFDALYKKDHFDIKFQGENCVRTELSQKHAQAILRAIA